ncbi:MAG: hypothetical protein FJY07_06460, partial [Bacteroidetes bacterium]|nr:hypothetical protein [Bacteroidota bacterium]
MKKGGFFYFLLTVFSLFYSVFCYSQREFAKNAHVEFKVINSDENYIVRYTFKDQFDNLQTYELAMPVGFTDNEISVFGVPVF